MRMFREGNIPFSFANIVNVNVKCSLKILKQVETFKNEHPTKTFRKKKIVAYKQFIKNSFVLMF